MANPFLVLGGIAVGVVTAAFGILQVPGWVSSAQDASAKNDISQVSILQSASLSQTGFVQTDLTDEDAIADLGVDVTTQGEVTLGTSTDGKHYAVIVESESGSAFLRVDGGKISEPYATVDAAKAAVPAATGITFPAP